MSDDAINRWVNNLVQGGKRTSANELFDIATEILAPEAAPMVSAISALAESDEDDD
jgi:hypothetical protein